MLEILLALVCLGVGMTGVAGLLGAALASAGSQGRSLVGRWQALAALERGQPEPPVPGFRIQVEERDGAREVRIVWAESAGRAGQVRLRVWHGPE